MPSHSDANAKSPLDAAQKIVAELAGMTTEHQSLALKFATETLGLQMAALAPTTTPAVHTPQQTPLPPTAGAGHSTDIRSFTALKAPKSDQQFATVVAYFYQLEAKPDNRKEFVDADIMREAARLAGWPQVQRWRMTLTNAKNAGYLDAAGSGKFKLSSVGENLVAITLPGNDGLAQGKKNSTTKKSKKGRAKTSIRKTR
ncbi:MAG TPA: hypothetical protein VJN67_10980 [Stellaceae bacterium]|nr:hypothetical protein [Stellaceae bacterium]